MPKNLAIYFQKTWLDWIHVGDRAIQKFSEGVSWKSLGLDIVTQRARADENRFLQMSRGPVQTEHKCQMAPEKRLRSHTLSMNWIPTRTANIAPKW